MPGMIAEVTRSACRPSPLLPLVCRKEMHQAALQVLCYWHDLINSTVSLHDLGQGSDIQAGEVVLRKGETIGGAEVGILATIGVTDALVSVGVWDGVQ